MVYLVYIITVINTVFEPCSQLILDGVLSYSLYIT